jgi:hypothetical protein
MTLGNYIKKRILSQYNGLNRIWAKNCSILNLNFDFLEQFVIKRNLFATNL